MRRCSWASSSARLWRCHLGPAQLGDVLDRQQDQVGAAVARHHLGVEPHAAPADLLEAVLHVVVADLLPLEKGLLQQRSQRGDVPLPVAELVDRPALGLLLDDLERAVEGLVRRHHAEVHVEHEQRRARGADDRLGVVAGFLAVGGRLLLLGDVVEGDADAVDPSSSVRYGSTLRTNQRPSSVETSAAIGAGSLEHALGVGEQVLVAEALLDVLDRAPDVDGTRRMISARPA